MKLNLSRGWLALYTLAIRLALPLLGLRLLARSRRQPEYRLHWKERLGHYRLSPPPGSLVWIHAVSVGETRAALSLLEQLRSHYPDYNLLLTHMTPTGRATASELMDSRVIRCYLPYDLPGAVERFLQHFRPRLGLLLETELWPNLIMACKRSQVPLALVNARMSERSARGYRHILPLTRTLLASLTGIAAQTEADALRLRALGAPQVTVFGNLKFDTPNPPDFQRIRATLSRLLGERHPCWLAASTRAGEEELILDLLQKLQGTHPDPQRLLILVPRHPQRFEEVARLLAVRNISFARRSNSASIPLDVQVLLGDSMGELQHWYSLVEWAIIGGTLLPYGGQNPIEATRAGCPTLIGPHTENFQQVVEQACTAGAAWRCDGAEQLERAMIRLLCVDGDRKRMSDAGLEFTRNYGGATALLLEWLKPLLAAQKSPLDSSSLQRAALIVPPDPHQTPT